ncbi:MAG: hypothetical protein ACXAEU_17190 [Candidatus Hodarchaeales archaeon]
MTLINTVSFVDELEKIASDGVITTPMIHVPKPIVTPTVEVPMKKETTPTINVPNKKRKPIPITTPTIVVR